MIKKPIFKINFDEKINDPDIHNFIVFAKQYNIFHPEPHAKLYIETCDKIKARLDREGLSYETVRPE